MAFMLLAVAMPVAVFSTVSRLVEKRGGCRPQNIADKLYFDAFLIDG